MPVKSVMKTFYTLFPFDIRISYCNLVSLYLLKNVPNTSSKSNSSQSQTNWHKFQSSKPLKVWVGPKNIWVWFAFQASVAVTQTWVQNSLEFLCHALIHAECWPTQRLHSNHCSAAWFWLAFKQFL